MRTKRWNLALSLGLLLALAPACELSTANISDLKIGKDKNVSSATNTFAPNDTVHAVATVSNVPDKVQVRGRLVIDSVEGEKSGPIPGAEKVLDMPGSGTASFTFTPPPDGWPSGKYKVEVHVLNEGGEQKDQKSADFTVS